MSVTHVTCVSGDIKVNNVTVADGLSALFWTALGCGGMKAVRQESEPVDRTPELVWLTIPEAAAELGVRDRDVRSMISERALVATRHEGSAPRVPADLLTTDPEGRRVVVAGLRGTVTLLADSGFDDEEIVRWLFRPNDELGSTPIRALIELRTHAVRRAVQALAF